MDDLDPQYHFLETSLDLGKRFFTCLVVNGHNFAWYMPCIIHGDQCVLLDSQFSYLFLGTGEEGG